MKFSDIDSEFFQPLFMDYEIFLDLLEAARAVLESGDYQPSKESLDRLSDVVYEAERL